MLTGQWCKREKKPRQILHIIQIAEFAGSFLNRWRLFGNELSDDKSNLTNYNKAAARLVFSVFCKRFVRLYVYNENINQFYEGEILSKTKST